MILVSILGDFHSSIFPIFYEFKDSIKKHIIVYDDGYSELSKNKRIFKSLEKFKKKYNLKVKNKIYKIDENSLDSIVKLVNYIRSNCVRLEDVYINTTDGLSNISVVLGSKLLDLGVKLISYDMYENIYNLTCKDEMVTKRLQKQMSIKDHFLLKGLDVKTFEDKIFPIKYKKEIRKLFEKYYNEFIILKKDITNKSDKNRKKYPNVTKLLKKMNLNSISKHKIITGGLFEFYIYLLVKDLGFDDIEIGIVIEDRFSSETFIKNEFDLLLMKDNHLHMIECKFRKKMDMHALVYKYSSLINLIDDDGRIIILTDKSTYSPDIYDKKAASLEIHRRALVNKILIRGSILNHKDDFIDDVKSYFNLYPNP